MTEPTSRPQTAGLTKTTGPIDKFNQIVLFFKDPPDASSLMRQTKYTEAELAAEALLAVKQPMVENVAINDDDDSAANNDANRKDRVTRYCGLQHADGNNARRVFIAARFLKDRLRDIIYTTALNDASINLTKTGKVFKDLAIELEIQEPSLKGVTAIALHATYDRLVEKYHEYQQLLDLEIGDVSSKTVTMEVVKGLYEMDLDFLQLKQERAELKDNEKKRLQETTQIRQRLQLQLSMSPLRGETSATHGAELMDEVRLIDKTCVGLSTDMKRVDNDTKRIDNDIKRIDNDMLIMKKQMEVIPELKRMLVNLSERTEWMISAMLRHQENMEYRSQQTYKGIGVLKDDLLSTKRKVDDLHEHVFCPKRPAPVFRVSNGGNYPHLQPPAMQ
ncbi:hypothetical protein EDD11_000147 [Mortierella claussenii]|nr:hypothetical protein EDD11_000147 [Mortierella claussenii]